MIDLIRNIKIQIDVAQFLKLDSSWRTSRFPDHRSNISYSRLYFPVEGEGYITFNNNKLHLRPGHLYLIPPYASTEVYCPRLLVKYWVHFNAFVLDTELDIFNMTDFPYELPVSDIPRVSTIFELMVNIYQTHPEYRKTQISELDKLEADSALNLLLIPFYKSMSEKDDRHSRIDERFIHLLHYIEQNLSKPLTLKKLSGEFHSHPNYLCNLFSQRMGIPLLQYCNRRRIIRAMDMLENSDYTIQEIATLQGTDNTAAFSRLFKRHVGCSPRAYRRKFIS